MRRGRSSSRTLRVRATDIAFVLVMLVGAGAALERTGPTAGDGRLSDLGPETPGPPSLVLSPLHATISVGATVALNAEWTEVPVSCSARPLWFRWTLPAGPSEGALESDTGETTNFTAATADSGVEVVTVSSGLLEACNGSDQVAATNASAQVTVVAPPVLENLTLGPNPIPANAESNLSVIVANGAPPYRLDVSWGDGNSSALTVASAGRVSISHRFPSGSFTPVVRLTDAAGTTVEESPGEPLVASADTAVAIDAPDAEVGIPEMMTAEVLHPPSAYTTEAFCDGVPVRVPSTALSGSDRDRFSCTFSRAGLATVEFELFPLVSNFTPALVELEEPVAPSFSFRLAETLGAAEVGRPTTVMGWLIGGAPPFEIVRSIGGEPAGAPVEVYADGSVDFQYLPVQAGNDSISICATDAAGGSPANVTTVVPVSPPLAIRTAENDSLGSAGAVVSVAIQSSGGQAPTSWWIVPELGSVGTPAANGTFGSNGSVSWESTYALQGTTVVDVAIVDNDGAVWTGTAVFPLVPPLELSARATGASNGSARFFEVNASIAGGVPPFAIAVSSSDAESWNASESSDGLFSEILPTNDTGWVELSISVEDWLGASSTVDQMVELPGSNNSTSVPPPPGSVPSPPSSEPSPSPTASAAGQPTLGAALVLVGVGLAVGLVGISFVVLRRVRRNRSAPPSPEIDPVAVIRQIVEPAEGAERSTVELLAEEEGVLAEVAHATIDRLIATGTLRSETGSDGEEVLAWSDPS